MSSQTLDSALALDQIAAKAIPGKAEDMAAYHKVERRYLGVANPEIDALARQWRQDLSLEDRLALAAGLWDSDIHEGRLAAAKLLTQARIRPDDSGAWDLICTWVPEFDAWAVADHAAIAGQKRLIWEPARIDRVEDWTTSEHLWTRRAALVMTLPWTRMRNPKAADVAIRERVLGWAAAYVPDQEWFIQKAIAWWLRDLSRHEPERVRQFLSEHGEGMKTFARKEAARHLSEPA
ncbi:3-methyladenine DNA glycosylase AlkD [Aliiruegeria haliotis]|uniref:3-methyladenine DNA glycosylase AlkD n=1 Tax=Aliiruegeria haliotis TaxID=1280846 RepID=A0A2T0RXU7_9RHOB|nr:DNA alkylation repair protein [Aliiruegeria haliotis]PRY25962.1 3-methyladenine DNA glycosylase AlkD [Aliiruegeria haliotis]